MKMFRKEEGFTLVELMVVVLIIGILVAIAVPVFLNASANAQAKSCQANQRTWAGALSTYNANQGTDIVITPGAMGSGTMAGMFGTGANAVIKTIPVCPAKKGSPAGQYMVDATGTVTSDMGTTGGWAVANHELGQ